MRNSEIYEMTKFRKPAAAEGRFCIDLTDPLTGKVKERVNGKNHIFKDSLFSGTGFNWVDSVSNVYMVLTDSTAAIDADLPYVLGQAVGFGIPSYSGSGTYRGAYNATNQKLAVMTNSSVRWKFQYDFTTAQANGTIGTIGLTHQHLSGTSGQKQMINGFAAPAYSQSYVYNTNDGRYSYRCSIAGIITKYDNWLGVSTTIDVSAITGTTSSSYKTVGYAPDSGLYYIYVYSSTSSLRKMYVFSDSTFSTLSTTYSPTNVAISVADGTSSPLYVYGNYMFVVHGTTMYIADFVNNTAYTTQTFSTYSRVTGAASITSLEYGTLANGKYLFINSSNSSGNEGYIYDLSSQSIAGFFINPVGAVYPSCKHPLADNLLPCNMNNGRFYTNCAIAAKKLDTPVTKTSSYGMTATYELEVFW